MKPSRAVSLIVATVLALNGFRLLAGAGMGAS